MPTYEYACEGCGHRFEEWQSFKDEPLKTCPSCKKKKLKRLISGGAAIIFKGSGFYETDYRQKDEAKKAGKSSTENGDNKPAEKTPTEAKAEPAKTETSPKPDTASK